MQTFRALFCQLPGWAPSNNVLASREEMTTREVDAARSEGVERRFRDLAESLPHLLWTCEGHGPCDYLSPQWVQYTGIPERAQLGYGWLDQIHPDDLERTKTSWAAAASSGGSFDVEFRIRRFDGVYRWFKTRAVPIHDATGRLIKWFGSNTDIQALRDAQDEMGRLNHELEARVAARTEELEAANKRLRATAAQLKTAQQMAEIGSWELHVESGRVVWSDQLFRIFGLPTDGPAPDYQQQQSLFSPESWRRLTTAIEHSVATGEGYRLEVSIVRGKEERACVALAEAIRDDTGTVERLVGTFQDTTERLRAEARLGALTKRLMVATSAARMGVWEWDVVSNTLVWDDAMHRLYETVPDRFSGEYEAWRSAVHPDDQPGAELALAAAVTGPSEFDTGFRLRQADGRIKHLRAAAIAERDPAGRALRMVGVNWDVTEQRVAELALLKSEALQRAVVAHSGPAIIATDLGGTITLFNRAAEDLLGYSAAELVGLLTPGVFHDPAEVESRRAVLESELGATITSAFEVFVIKSRTHGADANEWTYLRKDGKRVPVLLTVSSIRDDRGELAGYLGVAVDLTARKQQEHALLELNRLLSARTSQKEVLLQEVHHRVKNNLQVIASMINMQIRRVVDAAARAALEECQSRIRSIALIHESLYQNQDYSRIPFSEYATRLSTDIFEALAADPRALALDLAIEPLILSVDVAIPCGLILNELLTNALKHAFPGGRRGTISVALRRDAAGVVVLSVSDDGVGLSTSYDGGRASLGSQLISALVEQINGTLVVSRAGGTKFSVSFSPP